MKVIERALEENINIPQPRWWGTIMEGKRRLMRYGHIMLIIENDKAVWEYPTELQTRTDKAGIEAAKRILTEKSKNASNLR